MPPGEHPLPLRDKSPLRGRASDRSHHATTLGRGLRFRGGIASTRDALWCSHSSIKPSSAQDISGENILPTVDHPDTLRLVSPVSNIPLPTQGRSHDPN